MQIFLPLLLFPRSNISQSIAAWVEEVSSDELGLDWHCDSGLFLEESYDGGAGAPPRNTRADVMESWSSAPGPTGSLGAQWQCGVGLVDRWWQGWVAMVLRGGMGVLPGAEQELAQAPWPMEASPGPAAVCPTGAPDGVTPPLLVCLASGGAGNTATVHLSAS